ncbi:Alpha/Beta hydrolase protein [Gigaspora rosea]|uniref:Alpha/Beta hydrolase protein n=1 Tax=Gigaspora rosea TaxID=44941 RepID=A0A397UKS0_9GLOM|nr:Alpha/Beta hydrolase protein [Gigaspora rosea]
MSQYSLSSQYYEKLKQIQKKIETNKDKSLEEVRKSLELTPITIPDNCFVEEVKLDEKYVIKSKEYLVDKLKTYEDVTDEKWQCLNNGGLYGEWIKIKDKKDTGKVVLYMFDGGYYMGSAKVSRNFTCKIAENAECSVLAINYHLSPEHQFPVPLCDALAAYLYLTDPGPEAGFRPFNPKQIIFSGSSAGGGLAVATALFLCDIGLPLPAGLVLWSPWVDVTSSMPSYWKPEMDKTDWVVGALNTRKLGPSSMLYCENEALAIPYISPMLAENLGNLPPILCQVGGGERFLDSNILFCFRASDPSKFQLPKYATTNFINSPFKEPTEVILEVYDGTCHCFQKMIPDKISQFSIIRSCDFIKNHTLKENTPDEAANKSFQEISKIITTIAINPNCEIRELDEKYLQCLNWENIGVVPELEVDDM